MAQVLKSPKLKGDFGELIFEHFSQKNEYAYISLEEIYNTLTPRNELVFRYGYKRILVRVPDELVEEIRLLCRPSNKKDLDPSFVFDYLTVSLKFSFKFIEGNYVMQPDLSTKAFNWVEIKAGKGVLSENQLKLKNKTKIPLRIFRILTHLPNTIEVVSESD